MSFETPTYEEIVEIEKAAYRSLITGADTSAGSDLDIEARIHALAVRGNHAHAEYLLRQVLPTTTEGSFLREHCRIRGISATVAAKSTGHVQVTSTTAGRTVTSGDTLTHAGGQRYEATGTVSTATPTITGGTVVGSDATRTRIPIVGTIGQFSAGNVINIGSEKAAIREVLSGISSVELWKPLAAIPAAGTSITAETGAVVPVRALTAGAAGNKDPGDTLTVDTPSGDLSATATILDLASGGDDESEDHLRGRLLDWFANRPGSGNAADYRDWARTVDGVAIDNAFVYPGIDGLGSIGIVPMGISGARLPSTSAISAVQAAIDAAKPLPDLATVYAWSYDTDVSAWLYVQYAPGYEPDWSGSYTVSTGSTTTSVVLTTAPTAIEVGDRVVVYTDVLGVIRGYERTVTARSVSGTYSITLDAALPEAPVSTDVVLPGGPLFAELDAALDSIMDTRGPGDTNPPTRHPAPDVAFPDRLRESDIVAAVRAVSGVVDVGVTKSDGSTALSIYGETPGAMNRLRLANRRIVWVAP